MNETPIVLADHQLSELARLIALELRSGAPTAPAQPGLVSAVTLATALGVSPSFVYAHADELGAIRIGSGAKPRLRFDLDAATKRSRAINAPADDITTERVRRGLRRQPSSVTASQLLGLAPASASSATNTGRPKG